MGADEFDIGSENSGEREPTNAEEGAADDRTLRPETAADEYNTQELEAEFGPIDENCSELFGEHDSAADLFFDDGPLPDEKVTQLFREARTGVRAKY